MEPSLKVLEQETRWTRNEAKSVEFGPKSGKKSDQKSTKGLAFSH